MRTILDYTRTGRWQTIAANENAATDVAATAVPDISAEGSAKVFSPQASPLAGPGSAIRRLLEFTRTGRWLALSVPAGAPALVVPLQKMPLSVEEQALVDAAFFGLDVQEIPAEKWQEIAPLFAR